MHRAANKLTSPRVSVIVAAFRSGRTLGTCLEALENQSFDDFEIVIVDSTPGDASVHEVVAPFPRARAFYSQERLLPHQARNLGAEHARGSIFVFTDADCVAQSDWLKQLVSAHDEGHAAVGGAVLPLPGFCNWAIHFTKYGWWLPDNKPGYRPEIPSASASYERELLDRVGLFVGERFAGDSELSWRVRKLGVSIWFEPRAVLVHDHPQDLVEFISERYMRGKDFGLTRIECRQWPRLRSAFHLLLVPVLPLVMLFRAGRFAVPGGYTGKFLLTAPVQLVGYSAWCAGEARMNWAHLWAS